MCFGEAGKVVRKELRSVSRQPEEPRVRLEVAHSVQQLRESQKPFLALKFAPAQGSKTLRSSSSNRFVNARNPLVHPFRLPHAARQVFHGYLPARCTCSHRSRPSYARSTPRPASASTATPRPPGRAKLQPHETI